MTKPTCYLYNHYWYCSYCGCNLSFHQCWCASPFGSNSELTESDLLTFWNGRSKAKPAPFKTGYVAVIDKKNMINITFNLTCDWRGVL